MPGFNRKGPQGEGPMTGQKRGQCANKSKLFKNKDDERASEIQSLQQNDSTFEEPRLRRGLRRRNALGRGFGCRN